MSNTTPISSVPTTDSIEKPSLAKRGINFVKSNKYPIIAGVFVGLLVVAAAAVPEDNSIEPIVVDANDIPEV